ncbi:unnamed protein product [Lactuca virosa]|uniref:NB-ARC domain-containing protein n=1 Tax=Lactuca virosa TaxID=75947 RepID=A0AAU9NDD1_9ASTR|nr:unnamed protein product [Lactuca virosa]
MEVASEIMKGVFQVLMVPVKKQLDYLISYKQYVGKMHTKLKDLDAARVGVESQKKQNRERRLEVPAQVDPWLIEVEKMNKKVADFPSEVLGCLDLKSRHKLGRKAFKIFKEIESVLGRCPDIRGTELQIPVGRIDSIMASTSTPSRDRNEFRSREKTFTEALEALGPNHSSHMVALCGMGGVGKTTMMKKLKEVVVEKKMFNHYVEAVIGEKMDPIAIQQAVAEYLGIILTETTKRARTEQLHKWFAINADGGKKKFLVILDDVWQSVDMEDIGLSCLPNQGVDFKVLITSRDQAVCTEMGVKVDSVLKVSVLEEAEAQSLFLQLWEPSDDVDPDFHKIGEEIVRKCCGLPIAIKTMACTLRSKNKDTWKNALSRLQHHDINTVAPAVFKTSYDNLRDEVAEATFLLCGLFPEDFNIRTEDLLWYGWGLKLFKGLDTIREARYKLNTCIERLIHTNLLIESDKVWRVKMHDLVRAFVLDMFSKVEHASIVNHGSSKPGWPETENDVSASCKRISLTCEDIIEFPSDLKFPNLSILKLMHGDESLSFPQGFYEEMGKLQVISYDHMDSPLLFSSLECSTNIRVLRLHQCSLTFDLSSVGNLLNLEVLSFARSIIKSLPSTIGNLKKLRVLDVTGCGGLHIDNGVFKNWVRLEVLYAYSFDRYGNAISFTGDKCNEVAERWKNLSALEFEFFTDNAQWKNLSFENLERFKISVGRSLEGDYVIKESKHSFKNTLKLVTKKGVLLKSRINELFEKTEVLCLSVDGMNDLEDVGVKSSLRPQSSSFRNLRILVVSECAELKYLFTFSVAKILSNLEHLQVSNCPVMKELIQLESGVEDTIEFPKLKILSLSRLPELLGLCLNVNIIIELPQLMDLEIGGIPNITSIYSKNKRATSCLLTEKVLIPKLEKLCIDYMKDLKEIWPCDYRTSGAVKLREIQVEHCNNLVNMFPCNPMPMLCHLEELEVRHCRSIEDLFKIDLDCIAADEKGSISLKKIKLFSCDKLVNLFPWNFMPFLHHLEELEVRDCGSIEELFNIHLDCVAAFEKCSISLKKICVDGCDKLVNLFPCNSMEFLHHLEELDIMGCGSLEDLFNIQLDCVAAFEKGSISLKRIFVSRCDKLVNLFPCNPLPLLHRLEELVVWKCGSIEELFNIGLDCVAAIEKGSISLRRIDVSSCDKLVDLFPCNPLQLLQHLEELQVQKCRSIEALFNIDLDCVGETGEGGTSSLRSIEVRKLGKLQEVWRIKGANHSRIPIRGFQAVESIRIKNCNRFRNIFSPSASNFDLGALTSMDIIESGEIRRKYGSVESSQGQENTLFPTNHIHSFHYLRNLELVEYQGVEVIFEMKSTPTSQDNQQRILPYLENLDIRSLGRMSHVWKCNWNKFLILHRKPSESPFHNLTIIEMKSCRRIKYLFSPLMAKLLSNLKKVEIEGCAGMEEVVSNRDDEEEEERITSTSTHITSTTLFPLLDSLILESLQNLKCIGGGGGAKAGNNEISFSSTTTTTSFLDQYKFSQVDGVSWTLCQYPREISIWKCHALLNVIPWHAAGQIQKLQVLKIYSCDKMKEVFETQGMNKSVITLKLPNLKKLEITYCDLLEHIFTSSTLESLVQLEELCITNCDAMKEIVVKEEDDEVEKTTTKTSFSKAVAFPCLKTIKLEHLPELVGFFLGINKSVIMLELGNLKKLEITYCGLLEHIFTFSTLESLVQLEKLMIKNCKAMKVIVVKEEDDGVEKTTTNGSSSKAMVKFPRLKSITLLNLRELVGFFLGTNEFQWPSLDELGIFNCPEMKVFTSGGSTAPQLKYVQTWTGKYSPPGSWFNSHVTTTNTGQQHQETPCPNLESRSSSCPAASTSEDEINIWSFHNMIELDVAYNHHVEKIIPSNELLQLQKLEKIQVRDCNSAEEVFEALEGTNNSGFDESQTTLVQLPNLTQVELDKLPCLRYIWKSNRCTVFEFPTLTRVSIERCDRLEHVFSSSMVGSLLQLQELHIIKCKHMGEVFVVEEEEEESDGKMNEIVFPRGFFIPIIGYFDYQEMPNNDDFHHGKFLYPTAKTDQNRLWPVLCRGRHQLLYKYESRGIQQKQISF